MSLFTRASAVVFSLFLAVVLLIIIVWWPLGQEYLSTFNPAVAWWAQVDWLLIGLFLVMSVLITVRADLRADGPLALTALIGGLVIESWGTQTHLWNYYTLERPPLWILPAWPIATLAIDRLVRGLNWLLARAERWAAPDRWAPPLSSGRRGYYLLFGAFGGLMIYFARYTFDKPLTLAALALVSLLIASPGDRTQAVRQFATGAALGYFLELWGTTRACWTYYTGETPPLFAVLAHGMAAFAFWRTRQLLGKQFLKFWPPQRAAEISSRAR